MESESCDWLGKFSIVTTRSRKNLWELCSCWTKNCKSQDLNRALNTFPLLSHLLSYFLPVKANFSFSLWLLSFFGGQIHFSKQLSDGSEAFRLIVCFKGVVILFLDEGCLVWFMKHFVGRIFLFIVWNIIERNIYNRMDGNYLFDFDIQVPNRLFVVLTVFNIISI